MTPYFLRQRADSPYCAPYATAMLLALLGGPKRTRREALSLFGPERPFMGATTSEVLHVFRRETWATRSEWRAVKPTYQALRKSLAPQLVQHGPTLLAIMVRMHGEMTSHIVIASHLDAESIHLVDPMGQPTPPNARLTKPRRGTTARVLDVPYVLSPQSPVYVLRWRS